MSSNTYSASEQAILTTLLYSDIFSFPLTKEEIWEFLINGKKIAREEFDKGLSSLKKIIVFKDGFYCLKGREAIILKRLQNASEVEKKMQRALAISEKIFRIPSVLFIGISGGLAVKNVTKDDDIDLVIIVKKNTLFITRLLILSILESQGVRRSRNQKNTSDTICVNLLFDETALDWFATFRDMYTAREIAQMKPLFERDNMYQRFLSANSWIQVFLPNLPGISLQKQNPISNLYYDTPARKLRNDNSKERFLSMLFLNFFPESLTRFLQMSIMKRHQSIETISKHVLAFHPYDYRLKTLKQMKLKMLQFGLLTKI